MELRFARVPDCRRALAGVEELIIVARFHGSEGTVVQAPAGGGLWVCLSFGIEMSGPAVSRFEAVRERTLVGVNR